MKNPSPPAFSSLMYFIGTIDLIGGVSLWMKFRNAQIAAWAISGAVVVWGFGKIVEYLALIAFHAKRSADAASLNSKSTNYGAMP